MRLKVWNEILRFTRTFAKHVFSEDSFVNLLLSFKTRYLNERTKPTDF